MKEIMLCCNIKYSELKISRYRFKKFGLLFISYEIDSY